MTLEDIELTPSKDNSFKNILLTQLATLVRFCNVEFRGGFYTKTYSKSGEEKEAYVSDTREVFCNACFALAVIMQPEFTKEMKEDFNGIRKEIETITQTFIDKTEMKEQVVLGQDFYETDGDKILLEEYKNRKLTLYLKLFARISKEMKRKNYYEMSGETY